MTNILQYYLLLLFNFSCSHCWIRPFPTLNVSWPNKIAAMYSDDRSLFIYGKYSCICFAVRFFVILIQRSFNSKNYPASAHSALSFGAGVFFKMDNSFSSEAMCFSRLSINLSLLSHNRHSFWLRTRSK